MSTDSLRRLLDSSGEILTWDRWDQVKHSERFVFVTTTLFVALFSWVFVRSPVGDAIFGYHSLARTILIWSIFALGFNLLLGQTGLLSFGHAMFWGGAGYAAAWVAIYAHGDPILMLIGGVAFALILAFLTAFVLLRLHTVYFAIVTLAIAQMLFWFAREPFFFLTGGENGLSGISVEPLLGTINLRDPVPGIFGTLWVDYLYVFIAVLFVLVVMFITRVRKSPYGLIFKAIRENETRTTFVGLDVWRYKFAAYLLSGGVVGIAGALMTIESQFVGIRRLYWQASGDVVVITILGGLGTIAGPVIGAIVYLYFEGVVDGFARIGSYWLLMLAVAFTAVVWKYPSGFWGMIKEIGARIRGLSGDNA